MALLIGFVARLVLLAGAACAGSGELGPIVASGWRPGNEGAGAGERRSSLVDGAGVPWATHSASPSWDAQPPLRLPGCRGYELPLGRAAHAIASAKAAGRVEPDLQDVVSLLRALGSPHVWPRVWTIQGRALSEEAIVSGWSGWAPRGSSGGQRRCGTARAQAPDGAEVIAAVAVDVLADLSPLPLRVRSGQWLRLDARVLAPASAGQMLLLGPDGVPRRAPSRLEPGAFHSVFSVDQPGAWRLQVLLDAGAGPRPALEAWVFSDVEPDLHAAKLVVPGRWPELPEGASEADLRSALWAMIDAARRSYGLRPLRRDRRLDELAQAQARAMAASGVTAHDVGLGMPPARVERAGIVARRAGENVARASSIERAHGALWGSPSHRGNLLDPSFHAAGVGVVSATGGDVWVCELFVELGGSRRGGSRRGGAAGGAASRSSSRIWSGPRREPYIR